MLYFTRATVTQDLGCSKQKCLHIKITSLALAMYDGISPLRVPPTCKCPALHIHSTCLQLYYIFVYRFSIKVQLCCSKRYNSLQYQTHSQLVQGGSDSYGGMKCLYTEAVQHPEKPHKVGGKSSPLFLVTFPNNCTVSDCISCPC